MSERGVGESEREREKGLYYLGRRDQSKKSGLGWAESLRG